MNHSERLAVFAAGIKPDGKLGDGPKLSLGKWHALTFAWDLKTQSCVGSVDGAKVLILKQRGATGNGIYRKTNRGSPDPSFVCYLVAVK